MPGPNAWQKHRDNLAGRIVAEALLRIEAGMDLNPGSTLQPVNQEQTSAHLNPCRVRRSQSSIYAPLRVSPFEEKGLMISDLDTELEPLEPLSGFSEAGLELDGLDIQPFNDSDLGIEPMGDPKLGIGLLKDSELWIEPFEDPELNPDAKISSMDAKHGIEETVGNINATSGQLDTSVTLNEWDIEPSDGELEGDDNDAEADMMVIYSPKIEQVTYME